MEKPKRPKRPKGPYMCFLSNFRRKMAEGGLVKPPAQRDVCAAAGATWAAMSREEKEPFYEQSEKSKDVWAAHLQELQKPKEKNLPPKRPKGAYLFFLEECRERWKVQYPGEKLQQRSLCHAAGKAWAAMGPDERARYRKMSEVSKAVWAAHMHSNEQEGCDKGCRRLQMIFPSSSRAHAGAVKGCSSPMLRHSPTVPAICSSCNGGAVSEYRPLEQLFYPQPHEVGCAQCSWCPKSEPPNSASDSGQHEMLTSIGSAPVASTAVPSALPTSPAIGSPQPVLQSCGSILPPSPCTLTTLQTQLNQQPTWDAEQCNLGAQRYVQLPQLEAKQQWQQVCGESPLVEELFPTPSFPLSTVHTQSHFSLPHISVEVHPGSGSGVLPPVTPFSSQDLAQLHSSFSLPMQQDTTQGGCNQQQASATPSKCYIEDQPAPHSSPVHAHVLHSQPLPDEAKETVQMGAAAVLPSGDDLDPSLWLAKSPEDDSWQADIDALLATLEHDLPMEAWEEAAITNDGGHGEWGNFLCGSVLSSDSSVL